MDGAFDQRDGFIWMNGALIPWTDARVHVLTHGLHYASSVFEGERAYAGAIFKLREHTERLIYSAKELGFEIPYAAGEIDTACIETLEANGLVDGYLRPVAWRGSEMMGVSAQNNRINLAIAAWEWPSYFDPEERLKGIRLDMADYRRPSPETAPCHAKAAGLYMICTLSKHAAEKKGFTDALMLDYRGYIAEATGANIFFVDGEGTIHTPIADCFLDGITRRTVIQLAESLQMKVVQRHLTLEDVADMKECFLTGTAAEVTPVSKIGDLTFTPGDASRQLVEGYEDLVRGRISV